MKVREKIIQTLANENDKELLKNVFWAFVIKGFALIIQIFTLPAYIIFFDNQNVLGIWFTLLSVVSWIFTFDLGIGNGLRNKLVVAVVNKDEDEIKKTISSAYISIGFLLIIIMTVLQYANRHINWNLLLNIDVSYISSKSLSIAIYITLIGVLVQFLLKTVSSILYALQLSSINNLLALITSATQLVYVLLAPNRGIEINFINMAIAHALCVNIPLLIITILVFRGKKLRGCYPRIRYFDMNKAREILKLGSTFLWAQVMFMILTSTNEYLITYFTAPEHVVTYQIYNRLFTVVGSLAILALTPMWSAITKSVVEKNYLWMKNMYRCLHYGVAITILFEIITVLSSQMIFNIWLGDNSIQVDYLVATIFALYGSIFIWQTVESTIACGTGRMKVQTIAYTVCVVAKIAFSVLLMSTTGQWIYLIVVNTLVLLCYCIIQYFYTKRDFNTLYSNLTSFANVPGAPRDL